MKETTKKRIWKILCKIMLWVDEMEMKRLVISTEKIEIEVSKFIPRDGNWHHFSMSVDFWLKQNGDVVDEVQLRNTYVDGELSKKQANTFSGIKLPLEVKEE
jgi:hypothetical protein